ncbi:glutaredoxin-related protein 5, mitochondrial-like [Oscarella lobularis]|uniref:glutaredoxin-related protein 5, mitochondrial-like n=1 Tax=Oscarella lobularis TaxID=121494 RepID=UPI003313B98F
MALARTMYRSLSALGRRFGLRETRAFCSDSSEKFTDDYLDKLVNKDKIVVFMKGVPSQPMCGFSNAVAQILRMHGIENYGSHNILEDVDLKEKMKKYSKWPTFPQVYFNGELVGGCDIMLQMHQNGELVEALQQLGIRSALLNESNDK